MNRIRVAHIAVPKPLPGLLTYRASDEKIITGSLVEVPFRRGKSIGFVVTTEEFDSEEALAEKTGLKDTKVIKEVSGLICDETLFDTIDYEFYKWISEYYQIPIGEVFHSAYSKPVLSGKIPVRVEQATIIPAPAPMTVQFTIDQEVARSKIRAAIVERKFRSFLLHGVTGSGKTEVYLDAAEYCLSMGLGSLILVPEIALTPQLRRRFEDRFQNQVAVLHSGLTEKNRREQWWAIRRGLKKVVVGARSALFAPLHDVGLIVIDEEHEPSYKQEDRLRYSARDLAIVRARQHKAAAILGSATPSVETYHSALEKKHMLLELRTRPDGREMPRVEIIDMRQEKETAFLERFGEKLVAKSGATGCFSKRFLAELDTCIKAGQQAIVFVNRKGYSNFLLCKDCGDVPKCLNCSVSLTYYQRTRSLKCNYCGFDDKAPSNCGKCGSHEVKFAGLGTESVEEELRELLPDARIERLDAEAVSTVKKLEDALARFRSGEINVLVGTQMLAKGHDFPNVTFVGIVMAELSLHLPDFRASERTFQLLTQVSGRAGRGLHPGTVVLQTYMPENFVIQTAAAQDYQQFYQQEIESRRDFGYPPFSRMAQLEFRHLKEDKARKEAEQIQALLDGLRANHADAFEYLGPTTAAIAKVANQYRWRILLKSEKSSSLNGLLRTLRKEGVRFIDVDPISTL